MTEWPHLPNAPIREAVLDIQTDLPSTVSLGHLETIQRRFADRYPKRRPRRRLEGKLDLKSGEFRTTPAKVDGYVFLSDDERHMVQARLDGFTVNKLKPYARWESLRDEARTLWEDYVGVARPKVVRRIALRYINRLELPLPITDFKEYVRTAPDIAPGIPQAISGFFLRLEIPHPNGVLALVTEAIEPVEKRASGDIVPFILDIDVIRQETLSPEAPDLWEKFEELRDVKNEIFFKTITSKTEALFQ
jgi:uncharacterized protein (TIGR04255 family)